MAAISYKCPSCGAPLSWNPEKQLYFCEYCGTATSEEELKALNPDSTSETEMSGAEAAAYGMVSEEEREKVKVVIYHCPSCGAQIMTDDTTAATSCYYCHTPVVLADRLDGNDMPDMVLPFEVSREKAEQIFSGWIAQHKYVPKDFYSREQIELLSAVYFPYWVYDCETKGHASGEGQKIRTWMTGDIQNREVSVYRFDKTGSFQVENVSRIALKKASSVLSESVLPFDITRAKTFSEGYLQGYSAEIRDIDKSEMQAEMTEEIRAYAAQQLAKAAGSGYSSVTFDQKEVRILHERWRYALMPVYTMTYKDRRSDRLYYFSINGQSGKTCGELPVDSGRLRRLFFFIAVPVLTVLLLLFYFVF